MKPPAGLSLEEVQRLLRIHGKNELLHKDPNKWFRLLINQFNNVLTLFLFAASFISIILGDVIDAFFILLIIVINTLLGFIQEFKAEHTLLNLKNMSISTVRVFRDGIEQSIDSKDLVPGDIVYLEEGDKIPADGIVIQTHRFEINEASLTGESLPVIKSTANSKNSEVYMGTIVATGTAYVRITATGYQTKFGQMAASLRTIHDQKTPLEKKVSTLTRQLAIVAIGITIIIGILGILQSRTLIEMLLTSMSLAVAAVPEGLPAVITIALAVGLQRMAKQNAIIRKLDSIEALGNTTVIVTDKTGTLTENKMKVIRVFTDGKTYKTKDIYANRITPNIRLLIETGILCNHASLVRKKYSHTVDIIGEQTEGSLLLLANDSGIAVDKIKNSINLINEYSFDQTSKMMTMVYKQNTMIVSYTKGAPESILSRSKYYLDRGKEVALSKNKIAELKDSFNSYASQGLRILALARKKGTKVSLSRRTYETDITFIGFVGIADPPREEVKDVIADAQKAGIRTVMVTGDNPLTARAVALQIGLINEKDTVISGDELHKMTDEELTDRLDEIKIYARSTPQDKLRIVKLFQKRHEIVTVTGDGVNDALALKQANTGVAMGITGSDVAKDVADMVIMDDNYVSIVRAISEGRIIYNNMMTSIHYLLSSNLGEVLLIFGSIVLSIFTATPIPAPLLPIHILWINLVTDGLPALSIAFDRGTHHIMKKNSNPKNFIGKQSLTAMAFIGTTIAAISLSIFILSLRYVSVANARTITFNILIVLLLSVVFIVRRNQSILSNKLLLLSIFITILLQCVVTFVPPFSSIFFTEAIN